MPAKKIPHVLLIFNKIKNFQTCKLLQSTLEKGLCGVDLCVGWN